MLLALFVVAQGSIVRDEATLSDDEEPQWNDQEIPPHLGGWLYYHASVVVENLENKEDQTIVVLGGQTEAKEGTDSVILLDIGQEDTKQWREGPNMNEKRQEHAVVVCNEWVYAIGG